jgi:hypothetical protein
VQLCRRRGEWLSPWERVSFPYRGPKTTNTVPSILTRNHPSATAAQSSKIKEGEKMINSMPRHGEDPSRTGFSGIFMCDMSLTTPYYEPVHTVCHPAFPSEFWAYYPSENNSPVLSRISDCVSHFNSFTSHSKKTMHHRYTPVEFPQKNSGNPKDRYSVFYGEARSRTGVSGRPPRVSSPIVSRCTPPFLTQRKALFP